MEETPPSVTRQQVIEHNLRLHEATASTYDRIHYYLSNRVEQAWLRRDLRRLHARLRRSGPAPVRYLDLGCGTGNLALKLLRLGGHVTAVDLSTGMLEIVREKASRAGGSDRLVTLSGAADALDELPADALAGIDAVVMSSILHHLYDYLAPLRELRRHCPPLRAVYITHEPAARASLRSPGMLRRTVNRFVRGLDLLLTSRRGRQGPAGDDPLADYHFYREGVDEEAVTAVLASQGLRVPFIRRRYNMRRTTVVSALDNLLLRPLRSEIFPITMFTLGLSADGGAGHGGGDPLGPRI